ncbi:MAG: cytochrome c oxidase subunit II [Alphaproteobacteria bacterium 64-11]|nr:MAG: cytochrome c oxidase subunit II [Alphaproteobacteria bacterium 64-11]
MSGAGDKAGPVVWLTWGLLLISMAVVVLISALLIGAIWHRPGQAWVKGERTALLPHGGGLNWLWIGVSVSALVLLFSVAWTVKVLAGIVAPPQRPVATIEITGHQWWWEVRYLGADPARQFTTANEIHIPVGQPVRLKLDSGDVIHSFWVPQLAGKMDAIPGQTNETWIEADKPGVYRGQCTEYCGLEHARMGIVLVAQTPADFQKWWAHQLASPAQPSGAALAGQGDFQMRCGGCHAVRGTEAAGALGPDLSHLMSRGTIASGMLPNDPRTLRHWISDPQRYKPGALMPTPELSPQALKDVEAYLRSLT